MMPAELPVFKPSPMTYGGYNITWAVPKNSPHKEQAIKFLLFLNSPDVAEKWIRYTKSPTGIKGKLAETNFGLDKFENFQYTIDKKYKGNKVSLGVDTRIFMGTSITSYINKIFSCEITADQAMRIIKNELGKQRLLSMK
jgi:ABC-type glycerol-3-phosphate transport system substrate-binding protein